MTDAAPLHPDRNPFEHRSNPVSSLGRFLLELLGLILVGLLVPAIFRDAASEATYIRAFGRHWMYTFSFLLVGVTLCCRCRSYLQLRPLVASRLPIVLALVSVALALLNFICLDVYDWWKLAVRQRFYANVSPQEIRANMAGDLPTLQKIHADWYRVPTAPEPPGSFLAHLRQSFPAIYHRVSELDAGRRVLILDSGGGFTEPWGIAIGPPDMKPAELRYKVIEQWEPGVFFFDMN